MGNSTQSCSSFHPLVLVQYSEYHLALLSRSTRSTRFYRSHRSHRLRRRTQPQLKVKASEWNAQTHTPAVAVDTLPEDITDD